MHGLHYSNLDVAYIIVLINSAIAKAEFRVPNDNMCSDGRVLTQLLLPPPPPLPELLSRILWWPEVKGYRNKTF